MDKKYTPGHWKVQHSKSKDAFNVVGTQLGRKYKIARVPYLVVDNDYSEKVEAQANAQLVSAAPDLLEVLEKMTEMAAAGILIPSHVIEQGEDAITKALTI